MSVSDNSVEFDLLVVQDVVDGYLRQFANLPDDVKEALYSLSQLCQSHLDDQAFMP